MCETEKKSYLVSRADSKNFDDLEQKRNTDLLYGPWNGNIQIVAIKKFTVISCQLAVQHTFEISQKEYCRDVFLFAFSKVIFISIVRKSSNQLKGEYS